MARPINHKCRNCALEDVAEAKAKSCWSDVTCHSTRSHYRNRRSRNAKRREADPPVGSASPQSQILQLIPTTIEVEIPPILAAELYLYLSPNGAIHALEAVLWQGNEPICRVAPEHCLGLSQGAIKSLSEKILADFSLQSGTAISQWRAIQKLKVAERCPVPNCPLHRS